MDKSLKTDGIFLAGAVFFSMVLGFVLLLPQNFIGDDGVYYARVAASLMAGKGICANPGEVYLIHPPFYPLLIGILNLIFHNLEFSGHFVSIVTFSLAIIPLFRIAASIYSRATAWWVILLYITNGFLLIQAPFVTADMPFTFLIYTGMAALMPALEEKSNSTGRSILIWSFLMGLAHLTRPEGLFFWLAGMVVLVSLKKRPFWTLCSALIFSAFFVGYALFVYQQSGHFQLSRGVTEILIKRQMDTLPSPGYIEAKKIYLGLNAAKTGFEMDELVNHFRLGDYLRKDNFFAIRSAVLSAIPRAFELQKYWYAGIGFFLAGASFFAMPWDRRRKAGEFLFFLSFATLSLKFFSQFLSRYFIAYFPILLFWTGNGIEAIRQWAKASFKFSEKISCALALGICGMLALPSALYLYWIVTAFPLSFEYKEMGLWMKNTIPAVGEEAVLSRQPSVNFYSQTRILKLPYIQTLEDLNTFMDHQHAKYLAVSTDLDPPMNEAYAAFLDEKSPAPSGFSLKYRLKNPKGNSLFLYERTQTVAVGV